MKEKNIHNRSFKIYILAKLNKNVPDLYQEKYEVRLSISLELIY